MPGRSFRSWGPLALVFLLAVTAVACGSKDHTDTAAFCRHYRAAANAGAAISDVDAVSLDQFKAHVATSADEADEAAQVAPDEVRDAARRLARTADELRDASKDAPDRAALEAAVADYTKQAESSRDDASQVATWVAANCGLRTVETTTTTTTVVPLITQG